MPRMKKCATNRVKWGHLCEIDYRTKVGTPAWHGAHPRWQIRKLSAFRRLHDQHGHEAVSAWSRAKGKSIASAVRLRDMIAAAQRGTL